MTAKRNQDSVVVVHLDSVWVLSPERYRDFLRLVASGEEWELDELGKRIADRLVYAGDMTAARAKELLRELGRPKPHESNPLD